MAATIVPSAIVNLEVLSQDNYEDWSFRVKTYLLAERLWKIVEVTTEPPKLEEDEGKFDAWSERNAKALHTIHISCGHNAYAFIKGISMAKVSWDILAEKFKPTEVPHNADVGSDLHTNQTLVDDDAVPKKDMEIEAVEGGESMNGPFLEHVNDLKWDAVMEFIKIHPEAVRARHPFDGATALYDAVRAEEVDIVKALVQLMTMEDLEIKDDDGATALACAVLGKDTDKMVEIVKCMVEKNQNILTIADSDDNIPLLTAFSLQKWKMATYIYSVTPLDTLNDMHAAELVSSGFIYKRLDIPLDLIQHNPSLGITNDGIGPPLLVLARSRSAFLSGSRLKFWEQWIYDCLHVEPTRTMNFRKEPIQTQDRCQGNQRHLICSGIQVEPIPTKDVKIEPTTNINKRCQGNQGHFFRELVVTNLLKLVGINRIYQMKLIHVQALEILHHICEVLKTEDVKDMQDDIVPAIFRAVQLGQVEFISHIFKANPSFKNITDFRGRSLFQFAAECRQEKIYSLIYGLDEQDQKYFLGVRVDKSGNNMLHTIGGFSSFAKIDHIQGAALQMQRELQWFKEVEVIMRPHHRESINYTDHIIPHELFTKNHRELVKEGEKSMKETATSCTVVGALIVTIMFAAAFTVPGGNDGDTGLPIFLDQKAFKIFIASDAISLFFSTTSVMTFLGMLTSRYAQDDFLKSLPRKMILGLSTLFVSIAAMMVAFSSAMLLMLPGESWIAYPAILLSTFPIASFVWMQFPLLVDIFISTYGGGPFDRRVQRWDKHTK